RAAARRLTTARHATRATARTRAVACGSIRNSMIDSRRFCLPPGKTRAAAPSSLPSAVGTPMKITPIAVPGYERVAKAEDPTAGLTAYIAVHDTTLGPALGGLRMWKYESEDAALFDVKRLSRGMTFKSAVARTGLGGGKSVIVGDPRRDKTPALFEAMGKFVDSFGGQYITAEDVGVGIPDLLSVRKHTKWVTGLSRELGGSGNPSPYT